VIEHACRPGGSFFDRQGSSRSLHREQIDARNFRSRNCSQSRCEHADLLCRGATLSVAADSARSAATNPCSDPASTFNATLGNHVLDARRNVSGIAIGIRVSGRIWRFDNRDHRVRRNPVRAAGFWFGQADRLGLQHFRDGRSTRCDYDRYYLQRAGGDGTGLLDPGGGGAAIIGGSLRYFCSSPTPLGKLSPRCEFQAGTFCPAALLPCRRDSWPSRVRAP
jgi:hypothetical protein